MWVVAEALTLPSEAVATWEALAQRPTADIATIARVKIIFFITVNPESVSGATSNCSFFAHYDAALGKVTQENEIFYQKFLGDP